MRTLPRRNLIERIIVVDPEQVPRLNSPSLQGFEDCVVDEHAAKGADVDSAGGGF
jgi:hypothetical protein